MALIVQKFGGSSVKDAECIARVADIVSAAAAAGNQVVCVVSAMGKTTDDLIALADSVTTAPCARELDMLLATGEQVSIALLAMAIQARGVNARSFTGGQAGIITEAVHGTAAIKTIDTRALLTTLAQGTVAVVAGFQGTGEAGEIYTLGRGGSDTTAVALAAALKADHCDIYTDVNGVYTADPNSYHGARKLSAISYEEMLELASAGARVLAARSVETAMRMQVPVRLRSTFAPADVGTLVTQRDHAPGDTVCGIACDTGSLAYVLRFAGGVTPERVMSYFAAAGLTTEPVRLLGEGDLNPSNQVAFTIPRRYSTRVDAIVAELADILGKPEVQVHSDIVRISVVGGALGTRQGLVAAIVETLSDAPMKVQMVTTGDIRVTALVSQADKQLAVEYIHERFCVSAPATA